jgi:murein DD-endopeptidase MepM/ murein hydrolase activator NlpD
VLFLLHRLERAHGGVMAAYAAPVRAYPRSVPGVDVVGVDPTIRDHGSATASPLKHVPAVLGRGGTLAGALERLGLPPQQRHRAILALGHELDMSRLPASTGLRAAVDEAGRVRSVAVRAEPGRFVRWSEPDGEGRVEIVELPVRTAVRHGGGRVIHSVRQALDELDWAEELTLAFADIFQWDIDLLIEPRSGDRVRVVYEVEILDEVPADLPPFRRAASVPGELLRLGRVLAASYDGHIARSVAYWVDGTRGGGYFDATGAPLRKTFLKSPLNYGRISSGFSRARRNPVTRRVVPHHGIDFAAAPGTPVVAAADGRIVAAGWQGALGRTIRIRHGSEYVTVYGHLRGFARGIRVGAEVGQNQVIGYVGSTGRATGPHLHYTLIHRDRPVDPMTFRNPPAQPLPTELTPRLERAKLAWAPLLERDPLTVAGADWSGAEGSALRRGI